MNDPISIDSSRLQWTLCAFDDLNVNSLYEALALRSAVFVVEQNCVYADIDDVDRLPQSRHLLGRHEGSLYAYARSMAPATASDDARIGRVVVHPSARRLGLAKTMLNLLLEDLAKRYPSNSVSLDAQLLAEQLYRQAGFVRVSAAFLEDGIEHVRMRRAHA